MRYQRFDWAFLHPRGQPLAPPKPEITQERIILATLPILCIWEHVAALLLLAPSRATRSNRFAIQVSDVCMILLQTKAGELGSIHTRSSMLSRTSLSPIQLFHHVIVILNVSTVSTGSFLKVIVQRP